MDAKDVTASALFHVATGAEWEHATWLGTYAPESLEGDGFIHCSTATQHTPVANALFAGRCDLVLLLIDPTRLGPEHFEGADREGRPFPHVLGPVNLEAVFEAAPYRPGGDGRFAPTRRRAGSTRRRRDPAGGEGTGERGDVELPGAVVGRRWMGAGPVPRPQDPPPCRPRDLDPRIRPTCAVRTPPRLDLRLAAPEHTLSPWDGNRIELPYHQVWARVGPRREVVGFAADPR
jgi:uncharacterized protein (DUF952 family)